jgi:hypothetical protein
MAVKLSALSAGPTFDPRKSPGSHFCSRLSRPQGHSAAGRIRSIKKCNNLIGNRTGDLPTCRTMPQPTTLTRVPFYLLTYVNIRAKHTTTQHTKMLCYLRASQNYRKHVTAFRKPNLKSFYSRQRQVTIKLHTLIYLIALTLTFKHL